VILYHGSYLAIERPDLAYSREHVDFGKGFYTTPIKEQAARWSARFRRKHGQAIISTYKCDDNALRANATILEFLEYSEDWLDFVTNCRRGVPNKGSFDVIIGSVADDKVFDAIEAYFNGFYDKTKAIEKLRHDKPNLQYCFKNQNIIDAYLHFVTSEEVR
jgi:hypothetical protein